MQATATTINSESTVGNVRQHNPTATYKKVLDKRKHAIPAILILSEFGADVGGWPRMRKWEHRGLDW